MRTRFVCVCVGGEEFDMDDLCVCAHMCDRYVHISLVYMCVSEFKVRVIAVSSIIIVPEVSGRRGQLLN